MLSSPYFFPLKKYNSSVNEDNYNVSQSSHHRNNENTIPTQPIKREKKTHILT